MIPGFSEENSQFYTEFFRTTRYCQTPGQFSNNKSSELIILSLNAFARRDPNKSSSAMKYSLSSRSRRRHYFQCVLTHVSVREKVSLKVKHQSTHAGDVPREDFVELFSCKTCQPERSRKPSVQIVSSILPFVILLTVDGLGSLGCWLSKMRSQQDCLRCLVQTNSCFIWLDAEDGQEHTPCTR